jgi:hypothetical protein
MYEVHNVREILRTCSRGETLEELPCVRNHTLLHHTRPHPKELIGLLESIHIPWGGNARNNGKATLDKPEQWSWGQVSATLARSFGRMIVPALKGRDRDPGNSRSESLPRGELAAHHPPHPTASSGDGCPATEIPLVQGGTSL